MGDPASEFTSRSGASVCLGVPRGADKVRRAFARKVVLGAALGLFRPRGAAYGQTLEMVESRGVEPLPFCTVTGYRETSDLGVEGSQPAISPAGIRRGTARQATAGGGTMHPAEAFALGAVLAAALAAMLGLGPWGCA